MASADLRAEHMKRNPDRRRRVNDILVDAHAKATAASKEAVGVPVGLTLAMADDQALPGGEAALAAHAAAGRTPTWRRPWSRYRTSRTVPTRDGEESV
jgi:hypothetical protein